MYLDSRLHTILMTPIHNDDITRGRHQLHDCLVEFITPMYKGMGLVQLQIADNKRTIVDT